HSTFYWSGRAAHQHPPASRSAYLRLSLGDTTGIEVYDQLRSRMGWEEIPTLFVSATPPWHEIKARHLACLEKPFDLDELLTVVNTLLYCQREPVCVARGGFHATRVDEAIAC